MTKPYPDMSYDELVVFIETTDWPIEGNPFAHSDALEELDRKSAIMTAICKLAAELDEEGWVLVPREPTEIMLRHADGFTDLVQPFGADDVNEDFDFAQWRRNEFRMAWNIMIDDRPLVTLNHGETA